MNVKSFLTVAAVGVSLALSMSLAQAQSDNHRRHHYHHRYVQPYGGGTLMNNSNCPAGTQPHVWPNPSGYRCM